MTNNNSGNINWPKPNDSSDIQENAGTTIIKVIKPKPSK